MRFERVSQKQANIFRFPHLGYDALICDGAVRTGKTIMMTVSFLEWAMHEFNGMSFAVCGKTVRAAERNIIMPLLSLRSVVRKYHISYTRSVSMMTVWRGSTENRFYVFGGKDESSYMLIQGVTLAGVLFDEVALMPESFVDQAIARTLSVPQAKLWFNCNPESPAHWFYQEWVLKPQKHNAMHLHFLMEDNPGLTPKEIAKAKASFSGVFYDRYIRGEWVAAEGLVYPDQANGQGVVPPQPRDYADYCISCDYGTLNPCSMGLWGLCKGVWYRFGEYYHDGRKDGQRTDEEHYAALESLAEGRRIRAVVVDPSAASFITCIRRHGKFYVRPADNAVIDGIRETAAAFRSGKIAICSDCSGAVTEFKLYRWDEKANDDRVVKENDHAMDDIRYFVRTVVAHKVRVT